MTHKKKTLLATLLTLSVLAFGTPAIAHDRHGHKEHHGGGKNHRPDYGWHDDRGHDHHNNRHDDRHDKRWDKRWDNDRHHAKRYNFDMHVPRHLRHARHHLPVLIVIDGKGKYRGHSTRNFFERKAAREGFILAYAYDHGHYGHRLSNRDKDDLVRSVLNMLDGHYHPHTRRISFHFNF